MFFPIPLLARVGMYSVMWTKPLISHCQCSKFHWADIKTLWGNKCSKVTGKSSFGGASNRHHQQQMDFVSKSEGKSHFLLILGRCRTQNTYVSVVGIRQEVKYSHAHEILHHATFNNSDVSDVHASEKKKKNWQLCVIKSRASNKIKNENCKGKQTKPPVGHSHDQAQNH